jgi:alpha-1,6-rhamnosyltransferase
LVMVTIGLCLRNCEKDVKKIANRISSQDFSHENMEVIFVDDGSQDNTLFEIFQIAARMNIRYKVFHHTWKGLGYSRSVVLTNAQGEYIVWVDDGNMIPKDYVRKQVEIMEKRPNLGIVSGILGVYSGSNPVASLENMGFVTSSHKNAGKTAGGLAGTGGSVYRVKAAKQVGGFDLAIHGASEDTDLAYRILSAGWQIQITQVEFFSEHPKRLKKVFQRSFWFGYGAHFLLHKHKELREMLYKSTPFAGFLEGVLIFSAAYRLTHKKIALLLPVYYFSKRIMWCIGFSLSHIDSYGHIKRILPVVSQNRSSVVLRLLSNKHTFTDTKSIAVANNKSLPLARMFPNAKLKRNPLKPSANG